MIRLPSGRLVSPLVLNVSLRALTHIDQFRVIQERVEQLVVQLASKRPIAGATMERLARQLREDLGEPVQVAVEQVEYRHEDAAKFRTFVSKVALPDESAR
jgi:hypothetical protein